MDKPDDIDRRVGARIKTLRSGQALTLDVLAQRCGVSRAMLSRVERGESSPTAQLLVKICGGLGITLSALLAEPSCPARALVRRCEQVLWRDPASGYRRRSVSPPGTGSPVDIVEVEFPAGGSVQLDSRAFGGTDQHVWVLAGTLELQLGDDAPVRLETGDCMVMGFERPITFHNPDDRPVRYAVVVSHRTGP